MGKRIISQARGKGSFTYRIRKRAFIYKIGYPRMNELAEAEVIKLISLLGHSAPLAKIKIKGIIFYNPAVQGLFEGQKIEINSENSELGNILALKNIAIGTRVFNIEKRPLDGGKMIRAGGGFATVVKKANNTVTLLMNHKKEIVVHEDCRATIGVVAGQGRVIKPIVKAGKKHHMMKSRSKKWHTTSAVKVNAVDHPFGGGRGKRIKSKIAKRNAPPGRRVGHISPSRTGRK